MKAFIIERYGKKEKLQLTEVAEPVVMENDVLVQIHAVGVNLLNSKIRDGGRVKFYEKETDVGATKPGIVANASMTS